LKVFVFASLSLFLSVEMQMTKMTRKKRICRKRRKKKMSLQRKRVKTNDLNQKNVEKRERERQGRREGSGKRDDPTTID
jgi:hypothetical protein